MILMIPIDIDDPEHDSFHDPVVETEQAAQHVVNMGMGDIDMQIQGSSIDEIETDKERAVTEMEDYFSATEQFDSEVVDVPKPRSYVTFKKFEDEEWSNALILSAQPKRGVKKVSKSSGLICTLMVKKSHAVLTGRVFKFGR